MKTIFAILMLSVAANACPMLEGSYLCSKNASHPETLYTFTQKEHVADWLFKMEAQVVGTNQKITYQFLTDGFERETTEQNSGMKVLLTASCDDKTLTVSGTANLDKPQKIHFSEKLSLSAQSDLVDESLNMSGATVVETCVRQ